MKRLFVFLLSFLAGLLAVLLVRALFRAKVYYEESIPPFDRGFGG